MVVFIFNTFNAKICFHINETFEALLSTAHIMLVNPIKTNHIEKLTAMQLYFINSIHRFDIFLGSRFLLFFVPLVRGGFKSESGDFLHLQHRCSKSLSWAENLNFPPKTVHKLFKFSALDSDLKCLCWRHKIFPLSSDLKPPLPYGLHG